MSTYWCKCVTVTKESMNLRGSQGDIEESKGGKGRDKWCNYILVLFNFKKEYLNLKTGLLKAQLGQEYVFRTSRIPLNEQGVYFFFEYSKEKVKDTNYFNEIMWEEFKSWVKCRHICKWGILSRSLTRKNLQYKMCKCWSSKQRKDSEIYFKIGKP